MTERPAPAIYTIALPCYPSELTKAVTNAEEDFKRQHPGSSPRSMLELGSRANRPCLIISVEEIARAETR